MRWRGVRPLIAAAALAVAAMLLQRRLAEVSLSAILMATAHAAASTLLAAVGLTILSYACLAVVEREALRLVGRPLALWRVWLGSAAANAFSLSVGFGMLSGAFARLRAYGPGQLAAGEVGRLVLLLSGSNVLTGLICAAVCLLLEAPALGRFGGRPVAATLAAVLVACGWIWANALRHPGAGWIAPSGRARVVMLAAGVGDWLFSGTALYVLSGGAVADLPGFLGVFCLGSLLGSLLGVPGGLGVLEATLLSLGAGEHVHETAAALLLYRAIYFLGPLMLSATALAATFAVRRLRPATRRARRARAAADGS